MEKDINNDELKKADPAFNAAVDTLLRLSDILKNIYMCAVIEDDRYRIENMGHMQHRKFSLTKSYFIQATPLISDNKNVNKINEKFKKMKKKWVDVHGHIGYCSTTNGNSNKPFYSNNLEVELDDILIEIQFIIQKGGYFMPSGKEKFV